MKILSTEQTVSLLLETKTHNSFLMLNYLSKPFLEPSEVRAKHWSPLIFVYFEGVKNCIRSSPKLAHGCTRCLPAQGD